MTLLVPFLFNVCLLGVLHLVIPAGRSKWVGIHGLINWVVVCLTYDDMQAYVLNPLTPHFSTMVYPMVLVLLLHVYHVLFYSCVLMDYIHHIVMCSFFFLPLYFAQPEYIAFTNYFLFFVCGLPGGIDYFNMYRVYTKRLSSVKEKRYNSYLNMYLRSPGILYGVFLNWVHLTQYRTNDIETYGMVWYVSLLLINTVFVWNAQYFAREVCISYGRQKERSGWR